VAGAVNDSSASASPVRAEVREPAVAVAATGLVKRFGAVVALDRVSVAIRRGELFSLLGPSGCGKTTMLRVIAGLEEPDEGTLHISGQDALPVPAHRRPVNTVFQSYALFPHLSVTENVAFGLRMKRRPESEITGRVRQAMELTQIAELADRMPAQLSGGQKQRVALARAVVNEPDVLLLDEPLGALDLKLRKQLQTELRALQKRLGITFIHVTHDQEEALALSDRLAVMNAGQIEQLGEPATVYERPRTRFVAEFLGSCNLITGRPTSGGGGRQFDTALGVLSIAETGSSAGRDQAVTLAIRPEKIRLDTATGTLPPNAVRAVVEAVLYTGAESVFTLRANGVVLKASRLNNAVGNAGLAIGATVLAVLPESALVVLND
jgi:spermidine/putrescine transport system ATP-binding protein